MGESLGTRAARLAHRMLGHEHEIPGRALRHPWRRPGPGLPPPRERAGPIRVLQRRDLRHLLAAQWPPHQGRPEDLQVRPGHDRPDERPAQGPSSRYPPCLAALEPLSPADRFRAQPPRRDREGAPDVLPGLRAVRGADRRPRSTSSRPRSGGSSPSRMALPSSRRSPSTAFDFSMRWTTTSTPAGHSASSSRSLTPSIASPMSLGSIRRRSAPAQIDEYRSGMVVLKELSQILGLFRPSCRAPRPLGGLADRSPDRTPDRVSAPDSARRRTSQWPTRSATGSPIWEWPSRTGPTAPGGESPDFGFLILDFEFGSSSPIQECTIASRLIQSQIPDRKSKIQDPKDGATMSGAINPKSQLENPKWEAVSSGSTPA